MEYAGTASGAASGAIAGSVVPGIGTLIGAGVGAAAGAYGDNEAKKAEEAANPRPKNRRLTRVQEALTNLKQQQIATKMSVAQAAFEYGSNLRF